MPARLGRDKSLASGHIVGEDNYYMPVAGFLFTGETSAKLRCGHFAAASCVMFMEAVRNKTGVPTVSGPLTRAEAAERHAYQHLKLTANNPVWLGHQQSDQLVSRAPQYRDRGIASLGRSDVGLLSTRPFSQGGGYACTAKDRSSILGRKGI